MIATDEPMALVVMDHGVVKTICYLGYTNLQSFEYDQLALLAESRGYSIYLTTVEDTEWSFSSLYNAVQKAVG